MTNINEYELHEKMIIEVINFLKETNNHLGSIKFSSNDIDETKIIVNYYKITNNNKKEYSFTYTYSISYLYTFDNILYEFKSYLKNMKNIMLHDM